VSARGGLCWLVFVGVLIAIVLTSYGIRIATDAPLLLSGTEPEPEDFESRYVAHPWLAYLHMTPGVLYLLGSFGAAFWIALSLRCSRVKCGSVPRHPRTDSQIDEFDERMIRMPTTTITSADGTTSRTRAR
jgi:hypothetical protein